MAYPNNNPLISLTGKLTRIQHAKPDGWGVFFLKTDAGEIKFTGVVPNAKPGLELELSGTWEEDKYSRDGGLSFKARDAYGLLPKSKSAIVEILADLPHISVKRAEEIYNHWGDNAIDVIIKNPDELKIIKGLTKDRRNLIEKELHKSSGELKSQHELAKLGFYGALRQRIVSHFGNGLFKALGENPYKLLAVPGVTFSSLDQKLLSSGIVKADSTQRLSAFFNHTLEKASLIGHTWLPKQALFSQATVELAKSKFPVPSTFTMEKALQLAADDKQVIPYDNGYSIPSIAINEDYITKHLIARSSHVYNNVEDELGKIDAEKLNEGQAEALRMALSNPVSILTGGPGTGKTYTLKTFIDHFPKDSVLLVAPTGKAAKRMTQSTGIKARTIHSCLKSQEGFHQDVVVIDELSMVGADLLASFLGKIGKAGKRLLLVGDPDQLPSISPGRVLGDLLESELLPVARLTKVQRQAASSNIIVNATRIREGKPLLIDNSTSSDFNTTFGSGDQIGKLLQALEYRIPNLKKQDGANMDALKDVQVISPQHKGTYGCTNLNRVLQNFFNPASPSKKELKAGTFEEPIIFREGDKIMVTKNNYQDGVVNGDIGYLTEIGEDYKEFVITLESGEKKHLSNLGNVKHGYAITVHKCQGSEAPMVITFLNQQVFPNFRQRNLLYTAVTRAKEKLWLIGDEKTVEQSIQNDQPSIRYTSLKSRIAEGLKLVTDHPYHVRQQAIKKSTEGTKALVVPIDAATLDIELELL